MSTWCIPDVANGHYQDSAGLSTSGAKLLLDCPARYHYWSTRRRPDKDAFDFGHIVHALVLGKGEKYKELPFGSWRSKAAQAARDEARAEGLIPCLPGDLDDAQECAQAVLDHPQAGPMFAAEGRSEVSIWHDNDSGVRLKIRPDRVTTMPDGRPLLLDLKTTSCASRDQFSRSFWTYRYYLQAAFYRHVYAAAYGLNEDDVTMRFVAVESKRPHLVAIYEPDALTWQMGAEAMDHAVRLYAECTASDVWPAYPTDVQTLSMPGWTTFAHEEMLGIDNEIEL